MGSWIAIIIFIVAGIYVHHRGKVRHTFFRQLSDHSSFMAPINCFMYLFSAVPNKPYVPVESIPELKLLQENWQLLRDEGLALASNGDIKKSEKLDDIGFNSFFKTGWTRFYLKWYKDYLPSAKASCPQTLALLDRCPNIKAAMFVVLPPDATLVKHRDPYAGSLRYHLGLQTPNSEDCFIDVDGERYWWKDGEAVLFDETYIHYAKNTTQQDRLILFCDIERPMNNILATWVNKLFGRIVLAAASSPNAEGESTGVLNKAFHSLYQIRLIGKKLKVFNKTIYYIVKYLLFGGIFYLIFF